MGPAASSTACRGAGRGRPRPLALVLGPRVHAPRAPWAVPCLGEVCLQRRGACSAEGEKTPDLLLSVCFFPATARGVNREMVSGCEHCICANKYLLLAMFGGRNSHKCSKPVNVAKQVFSQNNGTRRVHVRALLHLWHYMHLCEVVPLHVEYRTWEKSILRCRVSRLFSRRAKITVFVEICLSETRVRI